jgi:hypothetical protein
VFMIPPSNQTGQNAIAVSQHRNAPYLKGKPITQVENSSLASIQDTTLRIVGTSHGRMVPLLLGLSRGRDGDYTMVNQSGRRR